jgi:hypothetical protein
MVDCCAGQVKGYQPTGNYAPIRANSFQAPLPPPPAGGRLLRLASYDAPGFGWQFVHPTTGNAWGSTNGNNQFREFIVAFSDSFNRTYTAQNRADWTIALVGTRNGDQWLNTASSVTGDNSPQAVGDAHVQVLGLAFVVELALKYLPSLP